MEIGIRRARFAEWLMEPIRRNSGVYLKVALAAVFINLFALASSLFTMVVYDRVLPNNATESLIALTIGVVIIIVFDFILKLLRSYFTDLAGAHIDRDVGSRVFEQLVSLRLDQKRGSTGALAGLMRELETLRDFFASATVTAIVDVPFILIVLAVIAAIGGELVFVPLVIIPLVIIVGWMTHPRLDRLSAEAMSGGLHKQSILVETIGGLETVKAANASELLKRRWNVAINDHSTVALRQRLLSNLPVVSSQTAQTASYVGIVVFGAGMVAANDLTMGGLIACSILGGRAVAPLGNIASLLSRLSSTQIAYRQINGLMETGREDDRSGLITKPVERGELEFRDVSFAYPNSANSALQDVSFRIEPGERVALIGRVGSGKSTIARLLLGLYEPDEGSILVDGIEIRQRDTSNLRTGIASTLQESVLFSGTIRDNIVLGRQDVDDGAMLDAAQTAGIHDALQAMTNGYDRLLADRGEGLSGGQRQAIALARALAGNPRVLLFDEPSSHMDPQTEARVIDQLGRELGERTMVVITHRTPFLRLVDRVIVIDKGRIVDDGPRDAVLQRLQGVGGAGTGQVAGAGKGRVTAKLKGSN